VAVVLLVSGLALVVLGGWRGYANSRTALAPLVHEPEPTRAAVEAGRPFYRRSRIRRSVRAALSALAWLVLAMYGLFMISVATAGR